MQQGTYIIFFPSFLALSQQNS